MSVAALAAIWAGVGVGGGLLARRLRRRRLTSAFPLLLGLLSLTATQVSAGSGPLAGTGLGLTRAGAGLLGASGVGLCLCFILADSLDGLELAVVGVCGAATVMLLGAGDALTYGLSALVAMVALGVRWTIVHPTRASLAAGRVAGVGAAALIAASAFLPVTDAASLVGPRPALAGGLLMTGVAVQLALVPAGGWAAAAIGTLRGVEVAPWLLLVAPGIVLSAPLIPGALPLTGRLTFQHGLLVAGLLSAIWSGIQAVRAPARARYSRVVLGDLALTAAGIGSTQPLAISGILLLILTHTGAAALLLQEPRAAISRPRRLVWIALSGLPPSPAFWARYLILEACASANGVAGVSCVVALGLLFIAAVLAVARDSVGEATAPGRLRVGAAWVAAVVTAGLGLAPTVATHAVFGGG